MNGNSDSKGEASAETWSARRLLPIIDVHAHPSLSARMELLRRKDPAGRAFDEGIIIPDWNPRMALDVMDQHGIAAMMMSVPPGTHREAAKRAPALARQMNDEMATIIAAHPRRFGAFAVLPLSSIDASLVELCYALDELHFDGVCLPTNVEGVYLGDRRFEPLFAELNRRRSVAFVHPVAPTYISTLSLTFSPALMEFMFDSARAVASMIFSGMRRDYPDFAYIATHAGGVTPFLAGRFRTAQPVIVNQPLTLTSDEVRQGLESFHFDLTASTASTALASLMELAPTCRLMMGFDHPIRPERLIAPAIAEVVASPYLCDADLTAIARDNALKLLPRLASRLSA